MNYWENQAERPLKKKITKARSYLVFHDLFVFKGQNPPTVVEMHAESIRKCECGGRLTFKRKWEWVNGKEKICIQANMNI